MRRSSANVELGNERLFEDAFELIAGKRVGLITNHSGVNSALVATADRLHATEGTSLAALFGPEHGIRGDAEDGVLVESGQDERTGVRTFSLYGPTRKPDPAMLEPVDVLLFDIQDVGARFYTYLYTMSLAMEVCAEIGVPFIVLDRPNPIGGECLEGNLLDPAFASFVGMYPIPIRYGMTVGELAGLFNEGFGINADLEIVTMRGWQRRSHWEETGLPWVPPSPNMPTVDTALVYPGMCYFEGTNVSEGRGTTRPFEQIGAPYIDGFRLADELNDLHLPGAIFRPVRFQPTFGKYPGEPCGGVQVHVIDRQVFRAVPTGFHVVSAVRRLWPDDFAWRLPNQGIHNFDKLAGTDRIRLALDRGVGIDDLVSAWEEERQPFLDLRAKYLLYN